MSLNNKLSFKICEFFKTNFIFELLSIPGNVDDFANIVFADGAKCRNDCISFDGTDSNDDAWPTWP